MYGRIYTTRVSPTAVSAALDLLELVPATDKPLIIHKIVISPNTSETNQQIQVTIRTLPATLTSGSGGSAPTTGPVNSHHAASGYTAEAFNTTRATTSGTAVYHADEGFPSQGGFEFLPDVLERPVIFAGQALVVGIEETLSGMTISAYAVVEEL